MRDPDLWAWRLPRPTAPPPRARPWRSVTIVVEPDAGPAPGVQYRWDAETEILTAGMTEARGGAWAAATLLVSGAGGAWVSIELRGGRFCGLEVAVWPPVQVRPALLAPRPVIAGHAFCPDAARGPGEIEVEAELRAERDPGRRTVRLGVGPARAARAVRVARDILVEVDDAGALAGVWLLQVPPLLLPA